MILSLDKESTAETSENQSVLGIKRDFAAMRNETLAVCKSGSAEEIRCAAEKLMAFAADDAFFYYPEKFDEDFKAFDLAISHVVEVLRSKGWSAADVIVWAYKVQYSSCRYFLGDFLSGMLDEPRGEYADPGIWESVAKRLSAELETFTEVQLDGDCSDGAGLVLVIRMAWKRAGHEEYAIDCWQKHVDTLHNWLETAKFLNQLGRFDEAIDVARRGIAFAQCSSDCGNDYDGVLQEPLADAFSGKGDHLKAAAILAEQFLSWLGAYEENRTVASFLKLLSEAEMAGVRSQTRQALIHALKTGINPAPLCDWRVESPVQEYEWRPVPKLVAWRAPDASDITPPWPLPRANEGLKFRDLRWETMKSWCQQDQEFLLKLAIAEGDKVEIAKRFDALPEYPNENGMPLRPEKVEMLRSVRDAMVGFRDDIVAEIVRRDRRGQIAPGSNGDVPES